MATQPGRKKCKFCHTINAIGAHHKPGCPRDNQSQEIDEVRFEEWNRGWCIGFYEEVRSDSFSSSRYSASFRLGVNIGYYEIEVSVYNAANAGCNDGYFDDDDDIIYY